jgi:outer membrane protein OmpA-like peptidoglycan-associated protein
MRLALALAATLLASDRPPGPPAAIPRWEAAHPAGLDGCLGLYVVFDSGSAALRPASEREVEKHLLWLRPMVEAGAWLEVAGHVDQIEATRASAGLGLRRAEAVRDRLAALGIDPRHVRLRDAGASEPMVLPEGSEPAPKDLEQNRYVTADPLMPKDVFARFFPPGGPIC